MSSKNEDVADNDTPLHLYLEEQQKNDRPASLLDFAKQNEDFVIQVSTICDDESILEQKWKCRFGLASKKYPDTKIERKEDRDYWIYLFCIILEVSVFWLPILECSAQAWHTLANIEKSKARMKLKRRWTAAQLQENEADRFSDELIQDQAEEPNKRAKQTGENESHTSGPSNSSRCSYISSAGEVHSLPIWDVWEDFLARAQREDTGFLYSPERYGIITCGEGISAKPEMPRKEYKELNKANIVESDEASLTIFSEYIGHVLNSKNVTIMEERARALPKYPSPESRAAAFYLQDMLLLFSRAVYSQNPNTDLSKSESLYNFYLLHPAIRAAVAALQSPVAAFVPGEEALQSMSLVLKQSAVLFTEREAYKADGVVRSKLADDQDEDDTVEDDDGYEAEIFLLETSNAYGTATKSKSGFDHHKAMFALLSMLKSLADEYAMAPYEKLAEVRFYFLHAYEKKLRLWSFYTPSPGVYIMKRDWTITVPIKFARRDIELYPCITRFWDLKKKLGVSVENMKKMRQEHFHQAKNHRFSAFPEQKLLSRIVDPIIKNLTFGRDSKGMYEQLPDSSLTAYSDNCDLQDAT